MKKLLLIFMLVFMIGLVNAEASFVFKQNEVVNYRFRCFDQNNSYCGSGTVLTISIEYPNGTNARDNSSMTHNPTYYNYSLPTDTVGIYSSIITAPTINGTISEFEYEVTVSGSGINITEGVIYVALLGLLIFFFIITLVAIPKLPSGNNTDDYGQLISINNLKYLKPVLYIIGWVLLLAIVFTSSNLASGYIGSEMFGDLLFNIWRIMFTITLPGIIIWIIFILVQISRDKEIKKLLERGIDVQGSP